MSDENTTSQERTEKPTPRRRERAREEGQVARSQELSAAVVLLAGAGVLAVAGVGPLGAYLTRLIGGAAASLSTAPLSPVAAAHAAREAMTGLLLALLPFLLPLAAVVAVVNLAQARGVVAAKPIQPDLSRVSPIKGLKRLFSLDSLFTLLKSLLKVTVLALVTWFVIARHWPELMSLVSTGASGIAAVTRELALRLALITGLAFLVVAGIDYAWQVFQMERKLRMTRQEVVREHRETEGDPLLKSRILAFARSLSRKRMLHQVPRADVVVTNPTHVAVALRYDVAAAAAPIVVAMGERKLAERIKEIARAAGVPLVENPPVARALLATSQVGKPIAPALYAAIAEILAFVYRQRQRLGVLEAAVAAARRKK